VLGLLKVWIREEEEHLAQLAFVEKVGQILHRVAPGKEKLAILD
jgi:hypothetical protein